MLTWKITLDGSRISLVVSSSSQYVNRNKYPSLKGILVSEIKRSEGTLYNVTITAF